MPLASSVSTSRWFRSSMTQRSVTKHTRRWPCEADGKVISSILRHGWLWGGGLLMSPGWKPSFLPGPRVGVIQELPNKTGENHHHQKRLDAVIIGEFHQFLAPQNFGNSS